MIRVAAQRRDRAYRLDGLVVPCHERRGREPWRPRWTTFVVDSGATTSVVSRALLPPSYRLDEAPPVRLADGRRVAIEAAPVHFVFLADSGPEVLSVRVAVMPSRADCLLGLDVVRGLELRGETAQLSLGHIDDLGPVDESPTAPPLERVLAALTTATELVAERSVIKCSCAAALRRELEG